MPSRALLTEVQTIPNADIVQALANIKIVATSGITTTLPATASTLAILAGQTFTGTQAFSGTITLVATTSTTGQILQGGDRFIHTFQPSGQNQNVFIGFQAGRTSTMTGGGNIGIGRVALQQLTSGANNVCLADGAGFQITSGSSNVIIGKNSSAALTEGSNNVACGGGSLQSLVSNSGNSAFGYQALKSHTGSNSSAIGFNAGELATGNNNVFVGHTAGQATATVGLLAGAAITSGTNNTMLGQASSSTLDSGTYRTAIGSDSRCQSDNAIKLGRDTLDKVIIPSWATAPTTSLSAGMLYYDTVLAKLRVYTTAWETITSI